ncbi:hypothetical protein [Stratiformator vulcanicus]|uniref:Uncharacterized protein n=1 Tax=Stratiformator vulcanicus TaxID=2527980 RepID=A0A517R032_9PLAN|nr:hypothetical protein [Stratiformator vulcanicus]QDT37241.1 hypothetical protein Pan189_16140 [Stratiformator vulcanicus]
MRSYFILVCVGCLLAAHSADAGHPVRVDADVVIKKMQQRAEQFEGVDISWVTKTTGGAYALATGEVKLLPTFERVRRETSRLRFKDSDCYRFDHTRRFWSEDREVFVTSEAINVLADERRYFFAGNDLRHPSLMISPDNMKPGDGLSNIYFTVSAVSYWHPVTGLPFDAMHAAIRKGGESAEVREVECVLFEFDGDHGAKHRLWIAFDDRLEALPIRLVVQFKMATAQFDWEYGQTNDDPAVELIGWSHKMTGLNGKTSTFEESIVTDWKRLDSDVTCASLKPELPAGTMVHDYRGPDNSEQYILREDGSKRVIRPGEYDGTNYEELLKTPGPNEAADEK